MEPRGPQVGILREGVADERQKRVERTRPADPAARATRPMLQRRAHRLMVDAEGGRDGPDLPVLAEIEAPDLGALRGRDHHPSSGRRGATAPGSATGSPARRPHSTSARGRAPVERQGRGVWRTGRRRGKSDPSRGAGRDRRADGPGDRGALPDCADGGRWRPAPSSGAPKYGSVPSSRRGHGRTPDRSRRGGGTSGRSSGGEAGPRCRSPRGDLRLDDEPKPWHNRSDWLGLSEVEAVTRVRMHPGPHLRLRPTRTLPERPGQHHGRGYGRCRTYGRTRRVHTMLAKPPGGRFRTAPTARHLPVDQKPDALRDRTDATTRVQICALSRERRLYDHIVSNLSRPAAYTRSP